jgi:hypothetical protein
MSREYVSKERKTSSENLCQKSKKQVQRICVKKRKTNSYERVQRVEGFKGNCQQIICITMWWKQIGMTSGRKEKNILFYFINFWGKPLVVDVGCIDSIGHMETQPKLRLLEELVW